MPKIKKVKELESKFKEVKEISEEKKEELLEEEIEGLPVSDESEIDSLPHEPNGNRIVFRVSPSARQEDIDNTTPVRDEARREEGSAGWRSFYETRSGSASGEEQKTERIYEMGEQTTNTTLRPRAQTRSIIEQAERRNLMQENQTSQNISRFEEEEDKKKYDAGGDRRKRDKERYWV